jgi:hypothetical protein
LQRIGADRTKGTIVVRGEIQQSALAYARSNGIGVAKFLPHNRIRFVAFCRRFRTAEQEQAEFEQDTLAAMTDPNFISFNEGFYAYSPDGRAFEGGFEQFLRHGFSHLVSCPVWRTDVEGWNWWSDSYAPSRRKTK